MGDTHLYLYPSRCTHHSHIQDALEPEKRDMIRFGDKKPKRYIALCKQKQTLRDRVPGISRYSTEACGTDVAAIRSFTWVRHSYHTPETPSVYLYPS